VEQHYNQPIRLWTSLQSRISLGLQPGLDVSIRVIHLSFPSDFRVELSLGEVLKLNFWTGMLFQNQQKMLIQESLTWQNPVDQQDHTTVRPGPTNCFGNILHLNFSYIYMCVCVCVCVWVCVCVCVVIYYLQ